MSNILSPFEQELLDQRKEKLLHWANSLLGTRIRMRGRPDGAKIIQYELGTHLNGIWVAFENEAYTRYLKYKGEQE